MWQKLKKISILLLVTTLLSGCGTGSAGTKEGNTVQEVSEQMEVHFLDVGQGDCTIIKSGEHTMLIDAGNNNKGTEVQEYLQSKGIDKLDYIVGTHPDADHIGGLDIVMKRIENEEILLPDVKKDTRTYEEVIEVANMKNNNIHHPEPGEQYALGEATFTIIAPNGAGYESVNDNSIGILLEHGENRFLFVGDAEETSEEEMLENEIDLQADVYKVSHHGSRTATTEEFLEAVDPEYAVISSGEGNSYGHPHAEVLNRLRMEGVKTFRTDEQGTIVAISDGKEIRFNMSASDEWTPGEPTGSYNDYKKEHSEKNSPPDKKMTFVVNTNTNKFHLPDCASVSSMKKNHCKKIQATKKEMIKKGYSPCKNCLR